MESADSTMCHEYHYVRFLLFPFKHFKSDIYMAFDIFVIGFIYALGNSRSANI